MEELGTKELMEVFDGLDVLAGFGGNVMKDGKLSPADLNSLVSLALKFDTLSKAFEGADGALAEVKDLDQAEVVAIIGRVYGVVKAFEAAKKA